MNTHPPQTIPAPDDGPRILFFSGGTALRDLSRRLVGLTRASAHVITPFDSGGSSAVLRRAFGMPAPGDLRNRLMALADRGHKGHPEVFELFAHRFPKVAHPGGLDAELAEMAGGAHPLVSVVPEPMRSAVREHLEVFMQMMPMDFDLRGASIGNLILTAGYLAADRNFSVVLDTFRILARVLGEVALSCEADLHLAAELADGAVVCGQHRITGKETARLASPPVRLWACRGEDDPAPAPCAASPRALKLVAGAELICFPMGSLFSSVVANLLPEGMGRAVAANPCPKVFIPNLGRDPRMPGHDRVRPGEGRRGCVAKGYARRRRRVLRCAAGRGAGGRRSRRLPRRAGREGPERPGCAAGGQAPGDRAQRARSWTPSPWPGSWWPWRVGGGPSGPFQWQRAGTG